LLYINIAFGVFLTIVRIIAPSLLDYNIYCTFINPQSIGVPIFWLNIVYRVWNSLNKCIRSALSFSNVLLWAVPLQLKHELIKLWATWVMYNGRNKNKYFVYLNGYKFRFQKSLKNDIRRLMCCEKIWKSYRKLNNIGT